MADESPLDLENDPVYQAAADWLVRLQQPSLSLEETIEWRQWRNADPRHARAFEEVEGLWARFDGVRWPVPESVSAEEDRPYDGSQTVSAWLTSETGAVSRPASKARQRRTARAAWGVAAGLVVVIVAAAAMFRSDGAPPTTFETPLATNRTITLSDGSVIELAASSQCVVTLDRKQRWVTLVRGEAFFHVAKDPGRPFRVRAGNADVEAVGTEFDVRRTSGHIVVSVVEGQVMVQPTESLLRVSWLTWKYASGKPTALGAGNSTTVDRSGLRSPEKIVNAETTVSWRQGRLAFEREPLRDVIENVNRYSATPITMDDERIGDVLITGTISVSDIGGWLESLMPAFGIHAERRADRIILKRSPETE